MKKHTILVFTLSMSLVLLSGCDKKSDPAHPEKVGAASAGAKGDGVLPAGHPAIGGGGGAQEPAAQPSSGPAGPVTEVIQAGTYTYLKIKTAKGEVWTAVPSCDHKVGDKVALAGAMEMRDFKSKTLNKTFPSIWFGTLSEGKASASAHRAPKGPAVNMGGHAKAGAKQVEKVEKATGEGAVTIEELYAQRKDLSGKKVRIHGQVVRYSGGIMGKNWLHLQDGSGKVEDGSHDIAVTTQDKVAVGDVITAIGKVTLDRDLGAGYHYDILIEEAELKR